MKLGVVCLSALVVAASATGGLADIIPGGLSSVGLTRVVDDTIISENNGVAAFANWEPNASVLGGSVFLMSQNTYALLPSGSTSTAYQRHALVFQPVGGGPFDRGDVFFGDHFDPYRGQVNGSRQNGNPAVVAGDTRPGGVHIMAGAEASPHNWGVAPADRSPTSFYPQDTFYSLPDRWDLGLTRAFQVNPGPNGNVDRYASVQSYWVDPSTLEQKPPMSLAQDAILGRLTSGDSSDENAVKFGGDIMCLSNGNFLVVADNRSGLIGATGPYAVIMDPEGNILKDSFAIDTAGLGYSHWSNVAAFNGGFCVRYHGKMFFFDNAGSLQGTLDQQDGSTYPLDGEGMPVVLGFSRGDEHRIASHINSDYVFLASMYDKDLDDDPGTIDDIKQVYGLAVYNAQTRQYVAFVNINEMTADHGGTDADNFFPDHNDTGVGAVDRVNLAVDALNRVVAVYETTIDGVNESPQVVCRVIEFDPSANPGEEFSYLTASFYPFMNYWTTSNNGIMSWRMSAATTTQAICIAANGKINLDNNPALGANSPEKVNYYTVISHPDPQSDPTTPVTPPSACPTVTSVDPDFAITEDGVVSGVTVTGTNFVSGQTEVSLRQTGAPTIIVPPAQVTVGGGGTSLTFDLDPSSGGSAVYDLFVTVKGSNCPPAELAEGFQISECRIPFADIDGDGFVDQDDFAELQRCVTIGGGTYIEDCKCFNRDGDTDIDLDDIGEFADCATGPAVPWSAALAPDCEP